MPVTDVQFAYLSYNRGGGSAYAVPMTYEFTFDRPRLVKAQIALLAVLGGQSTYLANIVGYTWRDAANGYFVDLSASPAVYLENPYPITSVIFSVLTAHDSEIIAVATVFFLD